MSQGNTTAWNPSDKGANVVLYDDFYVGANTGFRVNIGGAGTRSVRSAFSFSSGKYMVAGYCQQMTGGVPAYFDVYLGVANGSANLGSYPGSDANAWAITSTASVHNGSFTSGFAKATSSFGTTYYVYVNADASPKRAFLRIQMQDTVGIYDSGWLNFAGSAADPVTPTTGTDISGLGTPLYFIGGGADNAQLLLNCGGWPSPGLTTDGSSILPSGASWPDGNGGYVPTAGTHSLANVPAGLFTSQNALRLHNASTDSAWRNARSNLTLSASVPSIWEVYLDRLDGTYWNASQGAVILLMDDRGGLSPASFPFFLDGTGNVSLDGAATVTWPALRPTTENRTLFGLAYDPVHQLIWGSNDGGVSWYGDTNSTANGNPIARTHGLSLAGNSALGHLSPAVRLFGERPTCLTVNFGEQPIQYPLKTVLSGFVPAGVLRARVTMA